MVGRANLIEYRQAKRDRDKIDWIGGVKGTNNRRIQLKGHVLTNEGILFVLGTAPSHVSIPQIKMAQWPKSDK